MADDGLLPYLGTFSTAAEANSFTAAARRLRLTQAAVSQRIHALEQSLNTPLFHRRGGRVRLTEAGHQLYDFAQRILALHREARQTLTGVDVPVVGDLSLAASSVPGEHLLPALLSVFGRQHPHVRVRATVSDSMSVMTQVERGEAGLGLVGRKTDNPQLEFRPLARDRMVLVTPPGHPLARRKRVTVSQLASYSLVLREVGSGLRHCFETALERVGRSLADFRVALELGSNEAIKEAVRRGIGLAVLSRYAVEKEQQTGQLRAVEVSDLACDREMFVVLSRDRVLPPAARLFLTFLETHPVDLAP